MTTRARLALAPAALLLAACAPAASNPAPATPTTGEAVLRMMHDRYAGKWYRTLTFSQQTTRRMPNDSVVVQTWREYATIPGALRIEMGDPAANNGALYRGDSVFAVRGGRVAVRRAQRNALMLLGFDVYAVPTERIVQVLREEGYPMQPVRVDTWQGRRAYVVGGAPGDLHSKQFWIDADRLVFVRSLEPFPGDTSKTLEIRFDDYRPFGGGWVAALVDVTVDGKSIQREEYSGIRTDVALDPALFDPDRWASAPHPAP
jgi:hypothetical protein